MSSSNYDILSPQYNINAIHVYLITIFYSHFIHFVCCIKSQIHVGLELMYVFLVSEHFCSLYPVFVLYTATSLTIIRRYILCASLSSYRHEYAGLIVVTLLLDTVL